MGEETVSTIYATELKGIRMALEIAIRAEKERGIIFLDSQAALKVIRNSGNSLSQYIIR
jgi:hypothetical protein